MRRKGWRTQEDELDLMMDCFRLHQAATAFVPTIVVAAAKMTQASPTEELRTAYGRVIADELHLADIGVSSTHNTETVLGLRVGDIFSESDKVRLS